MLRFSTHSRDRSSAQRIVISQLAQGKICRGQPLKTCPRILTIASVLFLLMTLAAFGGVAAAQAPPYNVIAYQDSLGVFINYGHCPSSDYQNCSTNFGLYRSPNPGFSQPPVEICSISGGNSTFDTCKDLTAQGGQTYTYKLCTGGAALSDDSNCATSNAVKVSAAAPAPKPPTVTLKSAVSSLVKGQGTDLFWTSTNATNLNIQPGVGKVGTAGSTMVTPGQSTTYTLTATGPGGKAAANLTISVPCQTPWAAPGNVSGVSGLSDIPLKWTNPNWSAGQICPAPSNQVLIYRMGSNGWQQIATLNKTMNNGILPAHYTDSGLLQPHTGYSYEICEGGTPNWQAAVNCASPPGFQHGSVNYGIVTWGADPVLSATRTGANTVKLQLALDQYTVTSVVVTRQGSDDPCRQGGTLGNGLQGCRTTSIGPNGVQINTPNTVSVYNWNESQASQYPPGFQNSQSAPFLINLPDDTTVKPGVDYYYVAQVTWLWYVGQDSNTVTVSSLYSTAPSQALAGGLKSIKPNGSAPPPPPSGQMIRQSPGSRTMPSMSSPAMTPPVTSTAASPQPGTPARTMMMSQSRPTLQPRQPMLSPTAPSSTPLLSQPSAAAGGAAVAPAIVTMSSAPSPQVPTKVTNVIASIKQVQQKPHDPQALYALGRAYCASKVRNTGVSYMYMALQLAEQTGNAALVAQIKASLAEQGVSTR